MFKAFANLMFAVGLLVPLSYGQGLPDQMNFSRSNLEGPHLYGVSAYSNYSTYDFRSSTGVISNLSSRMNYGVAATAGWQRFHGRTSFSVRYTGGYSGDTRYSNLNTLHHNVVANLARTLGRKWTFELSATGQAADLSQSVFEPTNLAVLTQSGAAFDDLAASQSIGQFSSVANGLILSGGASPTATSALLLGNRIFTYNLNAMLTYSYSSRLRFSFGSFGMGGKRMSSGANAGIPQNYVLPRTLGGTASVSMSYDLSPRTDLEASVAQNYINSKYQKTMGSIGTVGLGRKMGKNWFLRGNGGVFISENVQGSTGTPPLRQATWGGSIGFRTHTHGFVASVDRTGQSLSGAATVGRNTIAGGSWSWSPVRSAWSVHASCSRYDTSNTGFVTVNGWRGLASINRRLAWNLSLALNYAYLTSTAQFSGQTSQVIVNSARLSLGWAPRLHHEPQGASSSETDQ